MTARAGSPTTPTASASCATSRPTKASSSPGGGCCSSAPAAPRPALLGLLVPGTTGQLVIANRTPAKAEALARRHAALAAANGVSLRAHGLADCGARFDVVVNATASS